METVTFSIGNNVGSGGVLSENEKGIHKARKLPDTPSASNDNSHITRRPDQLPPEVQEQFLKRKKDSHKRSRSLIGFQAGGNEKQELNGEETSQTGLIAVAADGVHPAQHSSSSQLNVDQSAVQKTPRSLPASPVTGRKGAVDAFSSSLTASSGNKEELMRELRWHYKQYVRASKRKKQKATEPNAVNTSKSIRTNRCDRCNKTVAILERVAVENHVFHRSCFLCAICNTWLNQFNYCFVPDHDKFYCVQHYQDIESASSGLQESEIRRAMGVGPGVQQQFKFVPDDRIDNTESKTQGGKRLKATEIMKEKIVLLNKRIKQLDKKEKKVVQTLNKFKGSDDEKRNIWLQWFDVMEERCNALRRQEQLSFKLREVELCHRYSTLERELRLISEKEESCKTDEDRTRENKLLQEMLEVVEKRDKLVLETETANQRHTQELEDLKFKKDEADIGQAHLVKDNTGAKNDAVKVSQALRDAPLTAKRQSQLLCPCNLL